MNPKDEVDVQHLGVRLYQAKPMNLDDWIELAGQILAICREPKVLTAA
jgi:hypothetical protein